MKIMKRYFFISVIFILILVSFSECFADEVWSETEYRRIMDTSQMPGTIYHNTWTDCGESFQFKIMTQPIVTPSTTGIRATGPLKRSTAINSFLIVRVGIKNKTDHIVSWLEPKSFSLQEFYLDIPGGTYYLNSYMSAKAADSFNLQVFFSPIQPGGELLTVLVFEVNPDVEGWIMTFSPFTREQDGPESSISFKLPKANRQ